MDGGVPYHNGQMYEPPEDDPSFFERVADQIGRGICGIWAEFAGFGAGFGGEFAGFGAGFGAGFAGFGDCFFGVSPPLVDVIQFRKELAELDKEVQEWKKAARESVSNFRTVVAQYLVVLIFIASSAITHPNHWERVMWGYGFDVVMGLFFLGFSFACVDGRRERLAAKKRYLRSAASRQRLIARTKRLGTFQAMTIDQMDATFNLILKDYEEVEKFPATYCWDLVLAAVLLSLHGVVVVVAGKIKVIMGDAE
ncbi:unnamed protein product [Cuscuta campestris]|uniref:Uncharacterized protein n=1 Tax=Cuscuta campestris TaxID=132261 RepID=A0A484KMM0_9ASTE|nr:unnamed protein product [Cuscuta campestris]